MSRSRLLLLLVVSVALAVLSPAATAAAEQIAYQCEGDICLIDPDNPTEHKDITNTASSNEWAPKWSPLGNAIAYFGFYVDPGVNETWDVYTVDPSESLPLTATDISQTSDRTENQQLDWSADGSKIAFGSHPVNSANPLHDEAYVGRSDGAAPPVAIGSSSADEGAPYFSPDGNTVIFARNSSILMAPSNGTGTPTPITAAGTNWSPDGRYLAGFHYGSSTGLVISNVDGTGSHELQKPADSGTNLDWSCDSTRVTYVDDEFPSNDQVWVAPVDGSSIGVAIPMPSGWIVPHNPTFSPDGTKIAFDARPSASPGYQQILVAPSDGSAEAVPITHGSETSEQPSWKPGPSCAGTVPPPVSPGGGSGSGSAAGGSSSGTGSSGGSIPATQAPIKFKLSLFNRPILSGDGHFMTIAGINCHAEGGHPTGKVAEFCAAAANAKASAVGPPSSFRRAKPKTSNILFAKGSVKVPVGKTKPLKLKITPAGLKLLKPGKTISLKLSVTTRSGTAKPVTKTKTVKLKVPAKK